jgi:hypothetical protein
MSLCRCVLSLSMAGDADDGRIWRSLETLTLREVVRPFVLVVWIEKRLEMIFQAQGSNSSMKLTENERSAAVLSLISGQTMGMGGGLVNHLIVLLLFFESGPFGYLALVGRFY